jgi:carboxyl-terminal processing protease
MKKSLLVVGIVVVVLALTVSAFAGGVLLGRFGARVSAGDDPAPLGPNTPVLEATQDLGPTDEPVVDVEQPTPTMPAEELPTAEVESGDGDALAASFDYELLREVLEILDEQYYGDVPASEDLAYGAVRGMLLALGDPYTSFIEPQVSAILNEDASGEFEGIGAWVRMREDGYLEIAGVMQDQPAEQAGVREGDIILAVGDQSIVGLGLYEAISYIRGPAGTEAELEILRSGEPESIYVTVVRARIEIEIVESRILDGTDIAYLRLSEFDANASDSVEAALTSLLSQDPSGLILDLRNNPGGWLNEAIEVSDLFLDDGLVVTQRDSTGREQTFTSADGDIGENIPMVVLVNAGSASASEIVAGAIQDRGRGILIGTTTLGKGSVQLPNNLEDGAQLRVTIARWYTPNEQALHGAGLTPDLEVEYPPETPAEEDPQLDQAIEYLQEGPE